MVAVAMVAGETRTVLVVDDDPKLCTLVSHGLAECGFAYEVASDAASAIAMLEDRDREPFAVVLLDIMLPDLSGWDLLARLRETGIDVPVIFVTARDRVDERVRGLRLGADDYLIKPFAFAELLARVDAVIRRRQQNLRLQLCDVDLDLAQRRVVVGDRPLDLTPKEFDLLRTLVAWRGRTVSRQRLLHEVWQLAVDPGTNVLDVHVARLRRKLDMVRGPSIRTVRGQGYSLAVGKW